jgi:hypothetical protein
MYWFYGPKRIGNDGFTVLCVGNVPLLWCRGGGYFIWWWLWFGDGGGGGGKVKIKAVISQEIKRAVGLGWSILIVKSLILINGLASLIVESGWRINSILIPLLNLQTVRKF